MKIRALTFMLGSRFMSPDRIARIVLITKSLVSESRYRLISTRIALPPVDGRDLSESCKIAIQLSRMVDYISIPVEGSVDAERVSECMKAVSNMFISVVGDVEGYINLVKCIVDKLGVGGAARVSLTINGPIATPYFPSAAAIPDVDGIMIALRYADDLEGLIESRRVEVDKLRKLFEGVYRLYTTVSAEMKLKPLGIDYSLSPWMDESVAKVIEKLLGRRFGALGTANAIRTLNDVIATASKGLEPAGFNEVMLPYAEDSRLMELGVSGDLTAYMLALLAPSCVAGVDMIPVPRDMFDDYVYECYSLLRSKMRPSGIRVLPVKAKPGETIELERFGTIPVPMIE